MRYLVIILVVLVFSSCEKTEKIEDYPAHKSLLVSNCIFDQNTGFFFTLSKSLSPLDNAPFKQLVHPRAYVKLYENDVLIDSFGYTNNTVLASGRNPKPNFRYRFEAFFPGFAKVTGEDIMPEIIDIVDVKSSKLIKNYDFSSALTLDMDLTLSNTHQNNDYIILEFNRPIEIDTLNKTYFFEELVDLKLKNSIFEYEKLYNKLYIKTNGQKINQISIRRESIEYAYGIQSVQNKMEVSISNCSKTTFEYLRRFNLQQYNEFDPFAEPTPISNNIKNGYGIFGAMGITLKEFTF
jgi:hypothetical protein